MVAMLQWLDARSFFFRAQLIGREFLALFVKVLCDRLSAHGCECRRTISFKLFHFGHFVIIRDKEESTSARQSCELPHSSQNRA